MNHIKSPIIFKKVFTKEFCDKILKIKNNKSFGKGLVSQENNLDKSIRKSDIIFTSESWIYNEITPLFKEANKMGKWNFNIDWYEPAQITKYDKGDYYKWHADQHNELYSNDNKNLNFRNKIRKISCSLLLSEPETYEGGSMDFAVPISKDGNLVIEKTNVPPLPAGTLIVFPSFIHHKVNPVTKGTRYSLVIWALGPAYA
tara:strand:+ start:1308 stop:1910 length:603 start_codon:yes stop_codon:yes gene_type:complete